MTFAGSVYWVGISICCIIKNDKIHCLIRHKPVPDKCSLIPPAETPPTTIAIISVHIVNCCQSAANSLLSSLN